MIIFHEELFTPDLIGIAKGSKDTGYIHDIMKDTLCCSTPDVHIHQLAFEPSNTQTGCPALCTCKIIPGFWKILFVNSWIVFCERRLLFPEGFLFAPAEVSAPLTACIAGAAVAELYSLYIEEK